MSFQFGEVSPVRPIDSDGAILAVTAVEAADAPAGSTLSVVPCLSAFDCVEIAGTLTAAFRRHPHVGNVLTHLCGSQWRKIEEALRSIADPAVQWADLSPLSQNLVELMWAEHGVTGRILKPYLREFVARRFPQRTSDRFLCRLADLYPLQETNSPPCGEHPAEITNPIMAKACV
jgi:hypothetical protein